MDVLPVYAYEYNLTHSLLVQSYLDTCLYV